MQISVELEGVGFGAGASFLVSIVSVYDDCVTVDRDAGVSDVSSSCEVCASLVPGFKLFDPGIGSCLEISPRDLLNLINLMSPVKQIFVLCRQRFSASCSQ